MVAYSTTPSLATVIKSYENWLHYGLFVHEPLTTSVRNVLHNIYNDPSYVGLPVNPVELYIELCNYHKLKLDRLHQKGILSWHQMMLLFPDSKRTYSENMQIPLLIVLIRNCTELCLPIKRKWHEPYLKGDQSKEANVVRASLLAVCFRQEDPKIFDKHTFDAKWQEGNDIVKALGYTYDSEALKNSSLDPTRLSILYSILQYHFIQHNALKSQLDCTGTEDGKSIAKASDQLQHEVFGKCKCLFISFIIL